MAYRFNATHIFAQDDGYVTMIGFADDEFEPSKFVILQKANVYDEQDKKMGMDKIHVQIEDESRSKYGGINAVQVSGDLISISLSDEAKSALSVDGDIEVILMPDHQNYSEVKNQLVRICKEEGITFTEGQSKG